MTNIKDIYCININTLKNKIQFMKLYIFLAYASEKDYPLKPFYTKLFEDHTKMKVYSTKHSAKYIKSYPNYISTYTNIEI